MAYGPIRGQNYHRMVASDKWVAVQRWWCDYDNIEATVPQIFGKKYPHLSQGNPYTPTCISVQSELRGLAKAYALLVAHYETLRVEGKGRLFRTPYQTSEHRTKDLQNKTITGPDESEPDMEWSVIRGTADVPLMRAKYRLETAYSPSSFASFGFTNNIDKVNNTAVPNFLGPMTWTLRYMGYDIKPAVVNGLVYVDHHFDYQAYGWNNWVLSQKNMWKVNRLPVLDANDDVVLDLDGVVKSRDVKRLVPAQERDGSYIDYLDPSGFPVRTWKYKKPLPQVRVIYGQMSFSHFNDLIVW